MPFPTEIQNALRVYDFNKGFWRRLFRRDQAAIRALRKLNDTEQTNLLKIYQCFIENLPKVTQESHKVYLAVTYLNPTVPKMMNELYRAKLLKHINFNSLNRLDNHFENLTSILKKLGEAQLLTQENLDRIAIYAEAPEKLSIIDYAVETLAEANRLKQEDFSELSTLLYELHNNQCLTQENCNHIVNLSPNNIRILTFLVKNLRYNDLLTQNNLDNIQKLFQKPDYLAILAKAVDMLADNGCLNQVNLNSIYEEPEAAVNIASTLIFLDQSELLTADNRSQLVDAKNQFLLKNEAYTLVWHPLETYLPTLSNINEKQSLFDRIIELAQQEDPAEKIKSYLSEINATSDIPTRRRANTVGNKFSTSPAKQVKIRSSLDNLLNLPLRPGTL